jgi:integrase/recombinase XerD
MLPALPEQGSTERSNSIESYLQAKADGGKLADSTLLAYESDLRQFDRYMQGIGRPVAKASAPEIREFLTVLTQDSANPGTSIARRLSCLRSYFRHLQHQGLRPDNPAMQVARPATPRKKALILTDRELLALLHAPDIETTLGLRDRAMLELTYRCGLRVSEVIALRRSDFDPETGRLRSVATMRSGGRTASVVKSIDIDFWALYWLRTYIESGSADELRSLESDLLFPSQLGREMTRQTFWYAVRRAVARAGLTRALTPRMLRLTLEDHQRRARIAPRQGNAAARVAPMRPRFRRVRKTTS